MIIFNIIANTGFYTLIDYKIMESPFNKKNIGTTKNKQV